VTPVIAEADDAAVERWMGRALDDGVDVQRLREATLFSFSSAADMLLFERLLSHGLNIRPCVCVNGQVYIDDNAYHFQ